VLGDRGRGAAQDELRVCMGWERNDGCFTSKHSQGLLGFLMATKQNKGTQCVPPDLSGWIYAARSVRTADERKCDSCTRTQYVHTAERYNRPFGWGGDDESVRDHRDGIQSDGRVGLRLMGVAIRVKVQEEKLQKRRQLLRGTVGERGRGERGKGRRKGSERYLFKYLF